MVPSRPAMGYSPYRTFQSMQECSDLFATLSRPACERYIPRFGCSSKAMECRSHPTGCATESGTPAL
jgi:hypothetical protein